MTPVRSTLGVGMRAAIYIVVGIGTLAGLVPALMIDAAPGRLLPIGVPIFLAGLVVYFWTVWDFVTVGRGTPLPLDPPRALVVHGLYRVVRNPMAIGFCLILLGEAVAFGSPEVLAYAAILFLAIHLFVVFVEEPGLRERYGEAYEAYCRSVPRWIPRLSGWERPGDGGRREEAAPALPRRTPDE